MNKTHPLLHLIMAALFWYAVMSESTLAMGAVVGEWLLLLAWDIYVGQVKEKMKLLELFAAAYKCKWPSAEAEKAAAEQLEAWRKQ